MGRFSKLWGSITGGIAGLLVGLAVSAGLGSCTDPTVVTTCTVAGIGTGQVQAFLMFAGSALFTFLFPANE